MYLSISLIHSYVYLHLSLFSTTFTWLRVITLVVIFQGKAGEDGKPGPAGKMVILYYNSSQLEYFCLLNVISTLTDILLYDTVHVLLVT